jgi:hypothetical protein
MKYTIIFLSILMLIGCDHDRPGRPEVFEDDFEYYPAGEYPDPSPWFNIMPGSDSTSIVSGIAYSGNQCFRLNGWPNWERVERVSQFDPYNIMKMREFTYQFAVMIPDSSTVGAAAGPTVDIEFEQKETEGLNCVIFASEDSFIYVKGISRVRTDYSWARNNWYHVKVRLDYDNLSMYVWVNGQEIASGIEAADNRTSTGGFMIATEWRPIPGISIAYFDDIDMLALP